MKHRTTPAALLAGLCLLAGMAAQPATARDFPPYSPQHAVETAAVNRELVLRLYFQFFNSQDIAFGEKVIAEDFIQHNPNIPTGRAPFIAGLQGLFAQFPQARWNIDHLSASGDKVWVHVHWTSGVAGDAGQEFIDIYRVENGVIVEHWDAFEPVSTTPANGNTQF